jgi:CubicO group peptidase (beta-lactamase class C family)
MYLLCGALLAAALGAVDQPKDFRTIFSSYLRDQGVVGGAYAVLQRGRVVDSQAVGMADLESKQPVDLQTIFHWASITKTFTAVAIMQLRDRGKLSLDDPLVKYVPELLRLHSPDNTVPRITLRQALSHTAGFQTPTWPYRDDSWQPFEPTEWSQLVAMMPYQELAFTPGARFQYSNPAFIYLGRVIEALTTDPYEVYLQKNILSPLSMNHAYFNESPYFLAKDRSNNYSIKPNALGKDKVIANGREFHTGITTANGGLNAPLDDMGRWVAFLAGGGPSNNDVVLSRKSLEEMWQPVVGTGDLDITGLPDSMGLSFFLIPSGSGDAATTIIAHTGHQAGFASFIAFNPSNGRGLVLSLNTTRDPGQSMATRVAYQAEREHFKSLLQQSLALLR